MLTIRELSVGPGDLNGAEAAASALLEHSLAPGCASR